MTELKVCFVGIGSIASRHIRNLKKICSEMKIKLIINAVSRNGRRKSEPIFENIEKVYTEIKDIEIMYDIIFITNPTEYHVDTLKEIEKNGKNFFIEKPIVSLSKIEDAEKYIETKESLYYVACPLRYNAVYKK